MKRHLFEGLLLLGLFGVALVVRLHQQHSALLYPDGYQYLLMARGIGEHLQPTTVLGPGGDEFVPSPDAAVKPLFPLLVAGAHALGLGWLDAARVVTATASALAVVALTLLAARLTGSRLAGLTAGLLVLSSPSVAFWSGFSGPDPIAVALTLAAAVAFVNGHPRAGGILTGLAICARPELVVVATAAAILSLRRKASRGDLARAAPAAIVTASLVFSLLRTPIAVQDWQLVWLAPIVLAGVAAVAMAPTSLLRYASLVVVAAIAVMLFRESGPGEVWTYDWPLIVLGAAGCLILLRDERRSYVATSVLGIVLLLGSVYVLKNPSLSRYFSLLLPAAALLAALCVASVPRRLAPVAFGAMALAIVAGFLRPIPGSRDYDMFSEVAKRVEPSLPTAALITAAPDAYAFWLHDRPIRGMKPGAQGAVLLDAAQRLYAPDLTATGKVAARIGGEIAFARPNGEIDAGPAVLVVGRVVRAKPAAADERRTLLSTARRNSN
jgi:Dolichyl-phosphate-mannose-protein mannosyltransferase